MWSRNSSVAIHFPNVTMWSAWQGSLTQLCLDFPYRLARFFSISSTWKFDPLRVIVTLVFAENPLLARCFGMICALSKWALHTRWPFVKRKFSLKYYKATTFVESYFLGTIKGKLLFMFLWIVFSMQGAIAHFTILGKKIYFLLSKGTFTSVNFTYSS